MSSPSKVIDRLPTLEEVEQELSKSRRDISLLQSLQAILKRREAKENAGRRLRTSSEKDANR